MSTIRIIPCLDVKDGRVVKGVRFEGLRDTGDPAELAAAYEAQGADELVVLDISATTEGRGNRLETVRRLRGVLSIPLTAGGGVRGADDVGRLLEAGADKVGVSTAAVRNPQIVSDIADRYGRACLVVAIDAARRDGGGGFEVVVQAGKERTGLDAVAWAREVEERGAGEVLLTSFDRDGTRAGYDLELIAALAQATTLPIIASGGAANPEHFIEAVRAGADAVLAASIFHDGDYTVGQVKRILADAGLEVRL